MTLIFSPNLSWMRTAQERHMQDTCVIQDHAIDTSDPDRIAMGEIVYTHVDRESSTVCGLDMRPGSERQQDTQTVIEYDATLRLPISTELDEIDRIKVTHRFGETLDTPLVYEISSPIRRGPSGIRITLKKANN